MHAEATSYARATRQPASRSPSVRTCWSREWSSILATSRYVKSAIGPPGYGTAFGVHHSDGAGAAAKGIRGRGRRGGRGARGGGAARRGAPAGAVGRGGPPDPPPTGPAPGRGARPPPPGAH